jgi:hypothetical protein
MKKLNKSTLTALGIAIGLIVLAMGLIVGGWVGCSSPVASPETETPGGGGSTPGRGSGVALKMNPWPVGGTGALRSTAGIGSGDIYQTLPLLNYAQMILMEDSEAGEGKISAFDAQVYRDGVTDHLSVQVETDKKYHVLVLVGHTNNEENPNNYDKDNPKYYTEQPTLLQSGYTKITATAEPIELKIPVAPLMIDMTFFNGSTVVSFPASVGTPLGLEKSTTYTVEVQVKTEGKNGVLTGDGLWPLKLADSGTRMGQTWANGKEGFSKPVSEGGYTGEVSLDAIPVLLGNWTNSTIGYFIEGGQRNVSMDYLATGKRWSTTGSAKYQFATGSADANGKFYFHLEYVPYNVVLSSEWTGKTGQTKIGEKMPIWIIRNGANDWAQNANTNFKRGAIQVGNVGNGYNGNGAIPIKVGAGSGNDYDFDDSSSGGTGGNSSGTGDDPGTDNGDADIDIDSGF